MVLFLIVDVIDWDIFVGKKGWFFLVLMEGCCLKLVVKCVVDSFKVLVISVIDWGCWLDDI